jgi:hypothetical protein
MIPHKRRAFLGQVQAFSWSVLQQVQRFKAFAQKDVLPYGEEIT